MLKPEPACLVIADISGYTSYLAGAELDHAQDILADLISTVVAALRPAFRLAKLEGDAAFAYVLAEVIDGSELQDAVEHCYFAFRRRLRDIGQASKCECNACILIPSLDLKLVVHHGTILRQRIAGREELVGSDVIVVHRLLKNAVSEQLGFRAYAIYTAACIRAMGADPLTLGLVEHTAVYEGIGEVTGWVRDLEAAWSLEQERTRVRVEPGDALWVYERDLPGSPELVWSYLTSPIRRPRWQSGVTAVIEAPRAGRRGVGTTNHCVHGKDAVVEEILDWRPFEYLTDRSRLPMPGLPPLTMSYILEPIGDEPVPIATKVRITLARPRSAKDRAILSAARFELQQTIQASIEALIPLLEAERRARLEQAAGAPEPSPPGSAGRHLAAGLDPPASPRLIDGADARI
ncbi:MAG: DUF2652 domain-containing protein [Chloroflexota bacterium]